MWIYSIYGCFSVVAAKGSAWDHNGTDLIQIRSRDKIHLERLQQSFRLGGEAIQSRTGTDYEHRIVVSRAAWILLATEMAADLDYTNFKAEISGEARCSWEKPGEAESWTNYETCVEEVYLATLLHTKETHREEGEEDAETQGQERNI